MPGATGGIGPDTAYADAEADEALIAIGQHPHSVLAAPIRRDIVRRKRAQRRALR